VYGPFFFMEMIITIIVYLDMVKQFLIPQTKMTKKDEFTSSNMVHCLEKCASTSTPITRVGGLVERH
jgi:hypothetical protein